MLRIAIVDDEQSVIDEIKDIVTSFFKEQDNSYIMRDCL